MCCCDVAGAVYYVPLTTDKKLINAFQFLYYFSTFWGAFGPTATTW